MSSRGLHTLCLIKPHAVAKGLENEIVSAISSAGFEIKHKKHFKFTVEQAEKFYCEHKEKKWFDELIKNITSGEVIALILVNENAVSRFRELMGNIHDPTSLRGRFGEKEGDSPDWIFHNAVHGSDSSESYKHEASVVFSVCCS